MTMKVEEEIAYLKTLLVELSRPGFRDANLVLKILADKIYLLQRGLDIDGGKE